MWFDLAICYELGYDAQLFAIWLHNIVSVLLVTPFLASFDPVHVCSSIPAMGGACLGIHSKTNAMLAERSVNCTRYSYRLESRLYARFSCTKSISGDQKDFSH